MGERDNAHQLRIKERTLTPASVRKRRAIIDAAAEMFLAHGYQGVSMDELAAFAGVAKQTVYSHFGNKEALFSEMVFILTDTASDTVHVGIPLPEAGESTRDFLTAYAYRQLKVVLTPTLMGLRRLAIGEAGRFPELARILYERGPGRALAALAELFRKLGERGLLRVPDPERAASHFNWLVMGEVINQAMLLGDDAVPGDAELRSQAEHGVAAFLAAYGTSGTTA